MSNAKTIFFVGVLASAAFLGTVAIIANSTTNTKVEDTHRFEILERFKPYKHSASESYISRDRVSGLCYLHIIGRGISAITRTDCPVEGNNNG